MWLPNSPILGTCGSQGDTRYIICPQAETFGNRCTLFILIILIYHQDDRIFATSTLFCDAICPEPPGLLFCHFTGQETLIRSPPHPLLGMPVMLIKTIRHAK